MKNLIKGILFLLFIFTLQATQCKKSYQDPCNGQYRSDTAYFSLNNTNSINQYHILDTIWFEGKVSDTIHPVSGMPSSFISTMDLLFLNFQTYKVDFSSIVPQLLYANIEFNPVISDGILEPSLGASGYYIEYRRNAPYNYVKFGIVPGRLGTYIVDFTPSIYSYGGIALFYNNNVRCTSYYGAINTNYPDNPFWSVNNISAISMASNLGTKTISKSDKNYFIFDVVP